MATKMGQLLAHFKEQGMTPADAMKAANEACVFCILRENPVARKELKGKPAPDADAA